MNIKKYHVFYRRSATENPEALAFQISADEVYREKLSPEKIRIIDEYESDINNSRAGFRELKTLIKKDLVHALYIYTLARLFRDNYEAAAFHELLEEHGVNLIVTANASGNEKEQCS